MHAHVLPLLSLVCFCSLDIFFVLSRSQVKTRGQDDAHFSQDRGKDQLLAVLVFDVPLYVVSLEPHQWDVDMDSGKRGGTQWEQD